MGFEQHREGVERLLASYRAIPADASVRLAKKTSNLFRARAKTSAPGLDVSGLAGVIAVDAPARTADVAGMCTYEDLVDATLPYGLAPLVVPQLKTITLGGAVTGLGIESTSFRNGLPHESVLEIDVLTGSGEIITATPDGEHAELFFGFPNSYGTLGYSTRLKIALEPVKKYVALRHVRFDSLKKLEETMDRIVTEREYDGIAVDYLDGVVFTDSESYLTLGAQTDEEGPVSDYTDQDIFYRSIQHSSLTQPKTDRLTIRDYLWRWGHRLVLVLTSFRCTEPEDPALLVQAVPAQQLLLEADRPRPQVRHRRSPRKAQGQAPARTRRPGRRGTHRTNRGLRLVVPRGNPDRTTVVVPVASS